MDPDKHLLYYNRPLPSLFLPCVPAVAKGKKRLVCMHEISVTREKWSQTGWACMQAAVGRVALGFL
jgi:hypothetical protein